MNPTTTEHDFRFPRRPVGVGGAGSGSRLGPGNNSSSIIINNSKAEQRLSPSTSTTTTNSKNSAGDLRADLQELSLDLSRNQDELQRSAMVFPAFHDDLFSNEDARSPEEKQKEDPLATQVWRFFSRTKQTLPHQERMENLTWRMMHMNLRKRRQEEDLAR